LSIKVALDAIIPLKQNQQQNNNTKKSQMNNNNNKNLKKYKKT
jgi:hypothetical protein